MKQIFINKVRLFQICSLITSEQIPIQFDENVPVDLELRLLKIKCTTQPNFSFLSLLCETVPPYFKKDGLN